MHVHVTRAFLRKLAALKRPVTLCTLCCVGGRFGFPNLKRLTEQPFCCFAPQTAFVSTSLVVILMTARGCNNSPYLLFPHYALLDTFTDSAEGKAFVIVCSAEPRAPAAPLSAASYCSLKSVLGTGASVYLSFSKKDSVPPRGNRQQNMTSGYPDVCAALNVPKVSFLPLNRVHF